MHYYILKTLWRLLGEICIETDALRCGIAASPLGLHFLHQELLHRHAYHWLPLCDQRWHSLSILFSMPCLHYRLFLVVASSGAHSQKHMAVFQFDRWGFVPLD